MAPVKLLSHARAWGHDLLDLAVIALLFGALAFKGADSAALSALFGVILWSLLLVRLLSSGEHQLKQTLAANAAPAGLAFLFVVYVALSVLPLNWGGARGDVFSNHAPSSISPYRTIEGLASFLALVGAFAHGLFFVRSARSISRAAAWLTWGALVFALAALLDYGGREHVVQDVWAGRLVFNFASPNVAADAFAMLAIIAAASLVHAFDRIENAAGAGARVRAAHLMRGAVAICAFITCLVCVLLTASRAGIVSAIAGLILFAALLWFSRRRRKPAPRTIAFAALAGVLIVAASEVSLGRFLALDSDTELRRVMVETHWQAFLARPVTGHGLNTFHELNALFATPQNWNAIGNIGSAHNIYVQALEETGVVGFALLGALVAFLLARGFRHVQDGRKRGQTWSAAVLASAVILLGHGWVDFGLQTPAIGALLAFCLAIQSGQTQTAWRSNRSAKPQAAFERVFS